MDLSRIVDEIPSYGNFFAAVVTAVATFFLWKVTRTLADASLQPHVVATLEPNLWSTRHFDLKINNTGNATAYDIVVSFDPPLNNGEGRENKKVPLEHVSVLRPGQGLVSYLSDYSTLEGREFRATNQLDEECVEERSGNQFLHPSPSRLPRSELAWSPRSSYSDRK